MKCCCCCKRGASEDVPVKSLPIFKPEEDRKCTDCFFCVLFLLFWVGMIVVAAIGFAEGDPMKLVRGTDYEGNTCGENGLPDNVYYPRITEDLIDFGVGDMANPLDITLFGICVDGCPNFGDVVCTTEGNASLSLAFDSLSLTAGTHTDADVLTGCREWSAYMDMGSLGTQCRSVRENCWDVPLNSTDYFFRCVWVREKITTTTDICRAPSPLAGKTKTELGSDWDQCITQETVYEEHILGEAQTNVVLDLLYKSAALFGRIVSDIGNGMPVIIVCGGLVSFLLGFLWLLTIKSAAGCIVWTTIWMTLILMVIVTIVAYFKAGILTQEKVTSATSKFNAAVGTSVEVELPDKMDKADEDMKTRWEYFAYVCTGLSLLTLILILWARKTVRLAIGIIKEASAALKSMKSLLLYPFCSFFVLSILVAYWVLVAVYVASSGDEISQNAMLTSAQNYLQAPNLLCPRNTTESGETFVVDNSTMADSGVECDSLLQAATFEPDKVKRYLLAYHLFGLLWSVQFIQAIGVLIVAGSVGRWYFTPNKANMPGKPVRSATRVTCRYHLGSIAFGALVIAIVQAIRAILEYLNHKTKTLQDKSRVWRCVFTCFRCCLWCFEKCIKFITKFAFILVAISGNSFCPSAVDATNMILSNAKSIAVVEGITTFLFVIGKVFIIVTSGLLAFAWLDRAENFQEGGDDELNSTLVPLAVTLLLAWAIAQAFLGIYQLAIDTILVCYCADLKYRKGTPDDPYFMSDRLKKIIGVSTKTAAGEGEDDDLGASLSKPMRRKSVPGGDQKESYGNTVSVVPVGPGGKPELV